MRTVVIGSQISRGPTLWASILWIYPGLGQSKMAVSARLQADENLSQGLRKEWTWCKEKFEVPTTRYLSYRCNSARWMNTSDDLIATEVIQ